VYRSIGPKAIQGVPTTVQAVPDGVTYHRDLLNPADEGVTGQSMLADRLSQTSMFRITFTFPNSQETERSPRDGQRSLSDRDSRLSLCNDRL